MKVRIVIKILASIKEPLIPFNEPYTYRLKFMTNINWG